MKEQAIEGRRDWAADIMEVGLYSALILVVTLLWGIHSGLSACALAPATD